MKFAENCSVKGKLKNDTRKTSDAAKALHDAEEVELCMTTFDGDYLLSFGEAPIGGTGAKYIRADLVEKMKEGKS